MSSTVKQYFELDYAVMPEEDRVIAEPVCELAKLMECMLPDGPEKSAGMRKLLEAFDCFKRSVL